MKLNPLLLCVLAVAACAPKAGEYQLPEPSDVVMYQINPRVFAAENSFDAVGEQLDSISNLGVNVLWFMPLYPIGEVNTVNSPYCIKDYRGVNPEFGTVDSFKSLIDQSHSRGLSVIIDWVANHTSWDSQWISDHPDWYTQNEDGEIICPEGTGWLDVADLNFDNAEMRLAMIEDMKYWVNEAGVDGFRCDAADFVPFDFWKQALDSLRAIPGKKLLMLAEGQRPDHFDAGFDMNYAWQYFGTMHKVYDDTLSVTALIKADSLEYAPLAEGKIKLRFTSNHDEAAKNSTLTDFDGPDGAIAAYVASTFIHGGALIYGSQEVGYPEPINFFHYVAVDWTSNPELREAYKTAVAVYNAHPALRKGSLETYPDDNVLMFDRTFEDDAVFVAVNMRNEMSTVANPHGGELTLAPYEYKVIEL